MAELTERWRGTLAAERAFDLVSRGEVAAALELGVSVVELIEHAALCGRVDGLAKLLAAAPDEDAPPRAVGSNPERGTDETDEMRGLFDLIAAYEAARPLIAARAHVVGPDDRASLDRALRARTRDRLIARLEGNSELIATRTYGGKTLLHLAAGAHDDELVDDLLRLGADPCVADCLGRTALLSAADLVIAPKARTMQSGYGAVSALIGAGADPDQPGGEGRQTPLHVAARRGNVGVAAALLDGGAGINQPDAYGVTPIQRATNCRQRAVITLLLARGATRTPSPYLEHAFASLATGAQPMLAVGPTDLARAWRAKSLPGALPEHGGQTSLPGSRAPALQRYFLRGAKIGALKG
jgi:Ankyrin repeats (3 copies)/Ankyrin repeat